MPRLTQPLLVEVRYKSDDGWHVFTSPNMGGLYVASRDAREAFDDVATAIKKLVKLDTGYDATVEPGVPYEEFEACLAQRGADPQIPHPAFIGDRTYTVHAQ
jgi:hypothetical protein